MEKQDYHRRKLEQIIQNLDSYVPAEYARDLLRLVVVASPITLTENEFTQARVKALSEISNSPEVQSVDDVV